MYYISQLLLSLLGGPTVSAALSTLQPFPLLPDPFPPPPNRSDRRLSSHRHQHRPTPPPQFPPDLHQYPPHHAHAHARAHLDEFLGL